MIIVADAADIVCGAILLHMTSNFAPHDKFVCSVEQFVNSYSCRTRPWEGSFAEYMKRADNAPAVHSF